MQTPDTTNDVPVIGTKALIIMHVMLAAFIALVHFKLTNATDF
ncbi:MULTISPECIES: hypothetical protein [Gluconobacter]|mgnify:CR=1 FL=1|uniref:Uncharacterized protein n=1 Tax=Gluconobacter albidus TaxID=318683 RepID=A0ABQ5X2N2_9PROT|nr:MULTISPECIES: hypothetical protein [Gluconobacter]GBQ87368.1 hypothetical protein AA3250_1282 [Gluconobacter albidus NBRC 3250]GLQ70076.1 hypothetical protein GCM10007866_25290 [Gluconobacter albidus]